MLRGVLWCVVVTLACVEMGVVVRFGVLFRGLLCNGVICGGRGVQLCGVAPVAVPLSSNPASTGSTKSWEPCSAASPEPKARNTDRAWAPAWPVRGPTEGGGPKKIWGRGKWRQGFE